VVSKKFKLQKSEEQPPLLKVAPHPV